MLPARVLIVDDSVVVRKVLSDIVAGTADLLLVGTAATAGIGLQKIAQVNPDVVILDVEMPEMDGIEAVARIRASWPRLPVLMCSTLTERGADVTLRALEAGASDYVAKPTALGSPRDSASSFRDELVTKLRALTARDTVAPPPRPPVVSSAQSAASVTVLGIGSSTGGPNALAEIFRRLPAGLDVPIFLAQHMPPLFTKMLSDRLTANSAVRVHEGQDGQLVVPGEAYMAPGNFHMTVVRDGTQLRLALNQEAPENSCRPAVDVLFRSLARVFGNGVLGCVLTGMGHDGTRRGAGAIVEYGGRVITQSPGTCVVASMPSSVAGAGFSDKSVDLDEVADELIRRIRRRSEPMAFRRMELQR